MCALPGYVFQLEPQWKQLIRPSLRRAILEDSDNSNMLYDAEMCIIKIGQH